MKVFVTVKRVIDYNVKARVKADQSGIDLTNVKMSMNPFDEIAVEEAVRLKEAGKVSEIIAISIGPDGAQETLRSAFALGADRGILVKTDQNIESLSAAKIFKNLIQKENADLVIMGKQAIDNDCNQTPQMLAGMLGWAQGTFISKVDIDGRTLTITREIDGGLETIACEAPCVLSTDLRLNTPRFPKLPNIMKAKQKPLEVVPLDSLGIDTTPRQTVLKVTEPAVRKAGIKVADVPELVRRLHEEARVI
jgi:electron transfer flavoprotein beta subunit